MNASTRHATPAAGPRWRRTLRYCWRIPLIALLLLVSPLLALLVRVGGDRIELRGKRLGHWLVPAWTTAVLRAIGIRPRTFGEPLPEPVMLVANHQSWIDIELVHSRRPASFVAKAEIARWPLVGFLAASAGTIFHQRGSTESMARVVGAMTDRLRAGRTVAAFPEGGIGARGVLRPFHARILQAALDAEAPLQPVALRYCRGGVPVPELGMGRGESFFANIWRLLGEAPFEAEVHFLDVVTERSAGRKRMAEIARQRIARVLDAV